MAALEELLRWEHRDLRTERLLREAKERRSKRNEMRGRPGQLAAEEAVQWREELADEESLLAAEEGLAAEGELLAEEEILAAEDEL